MLKNRIRVPYFYKLLSYIVSLCVLTTGCIGSGVGGKRSSGTPSGKRVSMKGIEEYFVGNGVMQYYLIPVAFSTPKGPTAVVDLTVRDTTTAILWATLRFSVTDAASKFGATDSVFVGLAQETAFAGMPKVLYQERTKSGKALISRLEVPLSPALAKKMLEDRQPTLVLGTATGRLTFSPTKKAKKRLASFAAIAVPSL